MGPGGLIVVVAHLVMGLAGLALFAIGAWGTMPSRRGGLPLEPRQRLLVSAIGLFMMAAVFYNLSGLLPLGE